VRKYAANKGFSPSATMGSARKLAKMPGFEAAKNAVIVTAGWLGDQLPKDDF
jgi:hypothetical protein